MLVYFCLCVCFFVCWIIPGDVQCVLLTLTQGSLLTGLSTIWDAKDWAQVDWMQAKCPPHYAITSAPYA